MSRRPTATFVLGAILALVSACGTAKAGTALPKGDDAADYVGGKFEQVIGKLGDAITDTRDVTNSLDAYFKFDDKWIHSTVTSARTGNPESRAVRHRSQKNPDEIIDTYTPAEGRSSTPTSARCTSRRASRRRRGCRCRSRRPAWSSRASGAAC